MKILFYIIEYAAKLSIFFDSANVCNNTTVNNEKRHLLTWTPLILMFYCLRFLIGIRSLRLGFNNHLININYHQKIFLSFSFIFTLINSYIWASLIFISG